MSNTLTVVIPVRNRAQLVARTLECLRYQTAPAFDVVLVDNLSTDNSLEVLKRWQAENSSSERPVTVLTCSRPGAAAARNEGLSVVTTPWVLFFDSDDEMHAGHIARVLQGIATHPYADVLGWNVRYGKSVKKFYVNSPQWHTLFSGSFATLRWAARTELVRRVGAWDESTTLWDDIELGARILVTNPVIYHLGREITVEVNPQQVSMSTNEGGDYIERIEAPLNGIAATMPESKRFQTDYVRMIVAGNTARSAAKDPEVRQKAEKLRDDVLARASSQHRLLLWAVYHFRRLGGRGQNRLLKLILD